jgi:hypothetical protein
VTIQESEHQIITAFRGAREAPRRQFPRGSRRSIAIRPSLVAPRIWRPPIASSARVGMNESRSNEGCWHVGSEGRINVMKR